MYIKSPKHYINVICEEVFCQPVLNGEKELFVKYAKEKYENLIRGLDKKSIKKIDRVIKDSFRFFNNSIFLKIKLILLIIKNAPFYLSIREEDGVYSYKNYKLANKMQDTVFLYKQGLDEVKDLSILKNKDIIDAGDSAIIFSPLTNKKVYSFEPVSSTYNLLLKTISLNNSTNIVPVNMGLGAKEELSNIELDSKIGQNSICQKEEGSLTEEIKMTSIDNFVTENKLIVGLIKTDVEGFEQELLKGARKTIETQKPILLISIYHNASDFFDIKPMIESWNLGYKFKIFKVTNHDIIKETMLIAEVQ